MEEQFEAAKYPTSIAGIPLDIPIYNASGVWCTTAVQLSEVIDSPYTGAVVTKSCTMYVREGNPLPRYSGFKPVYSSSNANNASINSMGLPNYGLDYYMTAAQLVKNTNKPYFVSICGMTRTENLQMLSILQHQPTSISGVEMNLSCPNIIGKPQVGYDFDAMDETLRCTFELFDRYPLGVKLPPYFDPIHFDMASDVLKRYPKLGWVTCINSIGNGLVVDVFNETTLIAPKGGLGGLGGCIVKPTALANVKSFRERLPAHIDIVGCGGIMRGTDIAEHLLCGASAVQVGTLIMERGIDGFQVLYEEFDRFMREKGYDSISDIKGKIKTISSSL